MQGVYLLTCIAATELFCDVSNFFGKSLQRCKGAELDALGWSQRCAPRTAYEAAGGQVSGRGRVAGPRRYLGLAGYKPT
jgi:hypothetical protein